MTVFSYPSELVDPYVESDDWFLGGIARATSDIAIAAWASQRDEEPYSPMHLAAIRYTTAGPEIGPLVTIEVPSSIVIYRVIEGQDTQVWVVAAQVASPGIRLGLVDVNIETLELTFHWKFGVPSSYWPGNGGVLATSWPEQNLIVLATNEGDPVNTSMDRSWVRLVDMTTGAVIQSIQTPPYNPDSPSATSRVFAQSIALHKETGRLLLQGDWYRSSTGKYRQGLWTVEIADTGFVGDWTWIADIPPSDPSYSYYFTRWSVMAATADGWSILVMGTYLWATAQWFHLALDGTITGGTAFSGASNLWNNNLRRPYDCAYDVAYDRSIGCFVDWGTRPPIFNPGNNYWRGFFHLEATGAEITALQVLPRSENLYYSAPMLNVAVVGPGRYVYLCASTDILRPRGPDDLDSFGPITYVGGEAVDVSVHLGGQADETKRAFRTVRTG